MIIDKNEFFREATIRICSSLDIETALRRTLQYLSKFIPITGIYFYHYESETYTFKPAVSVTVEEGIEMIDRDIKLSKELVQMIREQQDNRSPTEKQHDITIHNDIMNNPKVSDAERELTRRIHKKPGSSMRITLSVEGEKVGTMSLYTEAKHEYTSEHADLLHLISGPLAVAMLNIRKYQKLSGVRDLLVDDNRYLMKQLVGKHANKVIGANGGLQNVMKLVTQVAPMDSPVLLLGETGVGKEVIAHVVHQLSSRSDGPLITVNCGAIPENLIDTELFGHEKGAFTGAVKQQRGRFERAQGGTIFLDEIGELTPQAQVRLLRVLQNNVIDRVGGTTPVAIDTRVIAATHRNLEQMIQEGEFREDLWFRLNVFPITIPPLRDRKEDLHQLIEYFILKKLPKMNLTKAPTIAADLVDQLSQYNWPGNVRELENLVERALIQFGENPKRNELHIDLFPLPIIKSGHSPEPSLGPEAETNEDFPTLDDYTSDYIERVLQNTKGKIYGPGGAAEILGMNFNTLRSKMRKLGIKFGPR